MQLGCVAKVSVTNKLQVLKDWQEDMGLSWKEVAYLGQFLFFGLFNLNSIDKWNHCTAAELQTTSLCKCTEFNGIAVHIAACHHQKQTFYDLLGYNLNVTDSDESV